MLLNSDLDLGADVRAIGVFGSVAHGDAGEGSDIDILVVTPDEGSKSTLENALGSAVLRLEDESKLGMTEVYTEEEFRNSLAHRSDFLATVLEEIHPLFDPKRILGDPEVLLHE